MTKKSKRTTKLLFTFVAMVITFCMACFGVFAATSIAYDGSGSFVYKVGANVATTITGSYRNSENTKSGSIKFTDRETGEYVDTAVFTIENGETTPYTNGTMQFPSILIENLNDTYTFTFNVTNDMGDNYLNVKFSCSVNNEEHLTLSSPTYMIDTQTAALDSAGFLVVKPGSTGIYSVTISAADNASNLENGFDDALYTFGLTVQRGAEYTV